MNNIYIISFSRKGALLSQSLLNKLKAENKDAIVNIYGMEKYIERLDVKPIEGNLKSFVKEIFETNNIIIFIGSIGIAIRLIAPCIKDKTKDAGVIVIDELGTYVIPILSGHIGRANFYTQYLSKLIQAIPVITTATDINNVFSIDSFAKENNYLIKNTMYIKNVSARLLHNENVYLQSDFDIKDKLPNNIVIFNKKESSVINDKSLGIYISEDEHKKPFDKTLYLVPKNYHVGVGLRRDTSSDKFEKFILEQLKSLLISIDRVQTISSIDLKKDEKAVLDFSHKYKIPFITYRTDELKKVSDRFSASEFVEKITGVGNVCDTSAYLSSREGETILRKTSYDGMTISVCKESWTVLFDE